MEIPHKPGYGLTFRGPRLEVRWLRRKHKGPVAAPILPGCCVAMRRNVFEATGGWDEGLLHRGNVDNECGVRLWLLGYELMVTPETVVGHLFRRRSPYPVGWPQFLQNRLRLAFVHLKPQRLTKVVGALRNAPLFAQALLMLSESNVAARRRQMLAERVRTDDWLFERFGWKW
jgi:GT2 family glycosyltransferase